MQRLEWHCHIKSISGALYKAILYHGQSAGKEMANSAVFNFRRKRFPKLEGNSRHTTQQPETHDHQWWLHTVYPTLYMQLTLRNSKNQMIGTDLQHKVLVMWPNLGVNRSRSRGHITRTAKMSHNYGLGGHYQLHEGATPLSGAQNGCRGNTGCLVSGSKNLHFMTAYFISEKNENMFNTWSWLQDPHFASEGQGSRYTQQVLLRCVITLYFVLHVSLCFGGITWWPNPILWDTNCMPWQRPLSVYDTKKSSFAAIYFHNE